MLILGATFHLVPLNVEHIFQMYILESPKATFLEPFLYFTDNATIKQWWYQSYRNRSELVSEFLRCLCSNAQPVKCINVNS